MKKYSALFITLFATCFLIFSCSQNVEFDNTNENVKVVETLQSDFKVSLKSAITEMQEEARPLLNSIVFNEQASNTAIKKGGVVIEDDILNDDEIFDNLSEENKAKIQEIAENYFEEVQNLAKSITVFDKGLPEGVEETDFFVKYAGIEYSKCVPETLKMAYEIRDELYSDGTTKGARLWVTPRWKLIGAPLGAIFYSYKSDFTKEEKAVIRYAMDEWEEATDGAVKFYEKPLNWWGLVKWGLGITRNVRIEKVTNKPYSGEALPGNMPWSFMHLNIDDVFDGEDVSHYQNGWKSDDSWTHMTLIHELGHAICLQHEFERGDRDSYIEAENNNFPGTCGFVRWLQSWNIINYGTYDYKSCMNYYGRYYIKGTNRLIGFNDINKISYNDILTVKYLYSRISYKEMIENWQDTRALLLRGY